MLAIPLLLSADRTLCRWEFKNAKNVRSIGFPINKQARAELSYDPMNAPGSRNGSLKVNIEYSPNILSSIPVCFQRTDLVLRKGTRYRIDFQLRSSAPFWITVQAIEGKAPWRKLGETARDTFQVPADSWQKKSLEFTASEAFSGNLRLPTFYLGKAAGGTTVWIANVSLTELSDSSSAAAPQETPLWTPSGKVPKLSASPLELRKWKYADAWKKQDGARSCISLCNFWEIAPAASSDEAVPADPERWKHFLVPGHWKGGNISNFIRADDGSALELWNGKRISTEVHHAWYRRRIDLPSSLRGKEIFLRLERIDEGGEIRFNGKTVMAGTPDPVQSVRVNLTRLVRFDQENEILIRVDSPSSPNASKGGLMGAVYLETEPARCIGEPEIQTWPSRKKLQITFHSSREVADGTLRLTLRDAANGEVVWKTETPWKPRLDLNYSPRKLWSPENPNLYYMDMEWKDASGRFSDRCTRRFGFREFKVSGRRYLLNGKPILLRADTDYMKIVWATDWHLNAEHLRKEFRFLKQFHINAVYTQGSQPSVIADVADEEGILLLTTDSIHYKTMEKESDESLAARTKKFLETAKEERKFYNHPSRIAWIVDIWFNFHNGTTNGEYVGLKYGTKSYPAFAADGRQITKTSPDPNLTQPMRMARMKRLNARAALFRQYFPDMEAFTGGSGEVNGVYSTHIYHTWGAPRMELRALFSRYALQPELPIFIGEHNIPYAGSYYQLAQPYSVGNGGISLFMENAARDSGHKAYRFPPVYTRRPLHGWGKLSLQDGIHDKDPWNAYSLYSPLYLDTLIRNLNAMIPAWRACHVNGFGMFGYLYCNFLQAGHRIPRNARIQGDISAPTFKPEVFTGGKAPLGFEPFGNDLDIRPTLAATPFRNAMADTICAFFSETGDFLEENHAFFSGERLAQTLLLMNDSETEKNYLLTLSLTSVDGRKVFETRQNVRVRAYEHRKIPVHVNLPETAVRSEWLLKAILTPEQGEEILQATKALEVFPTATPPRLKRKVYVFDPEGVLLAALRRLKIPVVELRDLRTVPLDGTVVIGRRAFAKSTEVPDLCKAAEQGACVLVLEQEQSSSAELMKVRSREAFLNAPAHPVLQGFKDVDFSNWNGSFGIVTPYQVGSVGKQWSDFGNRNLVAGYVFRRPQHGNFRSLLVSGFDLFQTPLLEYTSRGCYLASTLEITDRLLKSPVPTHLLLRMISYLDSCGKRNDKTLFFGSSQSEKFLKKMKINFQTVTKLDPRELAEARCLILADPDFKALKQFRFEMNDFVYNGGIVLYLQTGKTFYSTVFPFAMTWGKQTMRQALCHDGAADSIWRNGWDNGDLYWHFPVTLPCFTNVPPEADRTDPAVLVRYRYGSGHFVFCSVLPDAFRSLQADRDTPGMFRYAATGKAVRLLSALLTSCGVEVLEPQNAYLPKSGQTDFILNLAPYQWSFSTDPANKGLKENWHKGASGSGQWMQGLVADGVEVGIGVPFENFLQRSYDGWAWYVLKLAVPEELRKAGNVYFSAGAIDDFDEVYINGKRIGKTGKETAHYWAAPRQYIFPASLLKEGNNVIAIRVFDEKGNGGIVKLPLSLSNCPVGSGARSWKSPWPEGQQRDYEYISDLIRQY